MPIYCHSLCVFAQFYVSRYVIYRTNSQVRAEEERQRKLNADGAEMPEAVSTKVVSTKIQ